MATSITRFTGNGNVLGDPDQQSTGQHTIVTFAVAIHYKNQPMQKVRCSAFGALGQQVQNMVKKGVPIFIDGHDVRTYAYNNQQNQAASYMEIILDQFRILSSKDEA